MKIIIEKDAAQKMREFPNASLLQVLAWKVAQAYEYEEWAEGEADVELRVYLDYHYDQPLPHYFWCIYNHGKVLGGQVGGFNPYRQGDEVTGEFVYSSNT